MKYILLALLMTPVTVYSQWTSAENVDEMEGTTTYFAISDDTPPTKNMDFPYSDVVSNVVIACKNTNLYMYIYFSDSPNLVDDETEDGYNLIKTRLKVDESIENISLTQTWGSNSLFLLKEEEYIEKAYSSNEFLLELNWYGNGRVYFKYDLSGSAQKINEIKEKCGVIKRERDAIKEKEKKVVTEGFSITVQDHFLNSENPPTLIKMVSGFSRNTISDFLNVQIRCNDVDGFEHSFIIEFIDGSIVQLIDKYKGSCPLGNSTVTLMGNDIPNNIIDTLNSDYSLQLEDLVSSVKVSLTGNVSSDLDFRPVGINNFEGDYEFSIFEQ